MTKTFLIFSLATAVLAQTPAVVNHDAGFRDTPMLPGLPYHVHDDQRPHPPVVTPSATPGGAPSDAIVLFDGKDLSQWVGHPSTITKAGATGPAEWKVENGYFEVVPKMGDIATRAKFGDVQLHIEWSERADITGKSQGRGNSGVLLQGRYEIQVLDSYQSPATRTDRQAPFTANGRPLPTPCASPESGTSTTSFLRPRSLKATSC